MRHETRGMRHERRRTRTTFSDSHAHLSCPMPHAHAPCLMPVMLSHRIAPVTFVGIDLGARRIGIATSDSGSLATPHSVLRNEGDVVSKVAALGAQLDAAMYVVGIARGAQQFRDFADALRQKTCKEVVLWDEALTTVEANEQ